MQNHDAHNTEPFGPVIYAYTRSQAVADGFQVEVTKVRRQEAGIRFPVFLTRAVYDSFVDRPARMSPARTKRAGFGMLFGCSALRSAKRSQGRARLPFALYVRNDNHRPRLVKLIARCGAARPRRPAARHNGHAPRRGLNYIARPLRR